MSIKFNNVLLDQRTIRVPGTYTEVDNSRALTGAVPNPHRVLILGQKTAGGSADDLDLKQITTENIGDGYFGSGSILGRMCKKFKQANPFTEVWAVGLSDAGGAVAASGSLKFSVSISDNGYSVINDGTVRMLLNGKQYPITIRSGWSTTDINSAAVALVNNDITAPVTASTNAGSAIVLTARNTGEVGNTIGLRFNFFEGQTFPAGFESPTIGAFADGANNPDISTAWPVIENEHFHHIINPYDDDDNFDELDAELEKRFGPLEDKQGHGYIAKKDTYSNLATYGAGKNSPFITVFGYNKGPNSIDEWVASFGGACAFYLNDDPARPLHTLPVPGILAPKVDDQFSLTERNLLLFDGISTWNQNIQGNVAIERVITTYQTNEFGVADASYLNIQTMFTVAEIRFQYKFRMFTRFLAPRFKLADDTFPVQPGQNIATPKTIKQEIVSLFYELRDRGLVDNVEEFEKALIVERDAVDRDRVNVLLPPDLINQLRILATVLQFIL
jgi:phage tail sheath gpL-like